MSPSLAPKRFDSSARKHRLAGRHDRLANRCVFGPDDGAAVALQRQHGKGAAGEEMLHGFTAMGLRMLDRGDDADLRIAPADAFDSRALAQARALAVGGDEEFGRERAAACKLRLNIEWRRFESGNALRREHLDSRLAGDGAAKRADQVFILNHSGAGFARPQIVVEAEDMRTALGVERAVGNLDAGDGFRVPCKLGPDAEDGEQALARRRQRRGAGVDSAFCRATRCRPEPGESPLARLDPRQAPVPCRQSRRRR